ncbi:unnamed protein product, partial [Musa hybrid cultivar]
MGTMKNRVKGFATGERRWGPQCARDGAAAVSSGRGSRPSDRGGSRRPTATDVGRPAPPFRYRGEAVFPLVWYFGSHTSRWRRSPECRGVDGDAVPPDAPCREVIPVRADPAALVTVSVVHATRSRSLLSSRGFERPYQVRPPPPSVYLRGVRRDGAGGGDQWAEVLSWEPSAFKYHNFLVGVIQPLLSFMDDGFLAPL